MPPPAKAPTKAPATRGRGRGRTRSGKQPDDDGNVVVAVDVDVDVDATPRPRRVRITNTAPSLPAPRSPTLSSNSRSGRSTSPVKGLSDLRANADFEHLNLDDMADDADDALGGPASELFNRLATQRSGFSVVPFSVKAQIESTGRGRRLGLADPNFFPDSRPDLAIHTEYLAVENIVHWASELARDNDHEPAWNEQVHSRVFEAALSSHRASVSFRNITKADISPKDLIPRHALGGDLQGKMVDYAIYLERTEAMRQRDRDALVREARKGPPTGIAMSANHTTYAPLRQRPIAVSIETKSSSGRSDEALGQLGVWGAAHLARLGRLVAPGTGLPTLPLVLVTGIDWNLYFIGRGRACGVEKTRVFGSIQLGDTRSLLGVYRLLRAIRMLADWAGSFYKDWWESFILT